MTDMEDRPNTVNVNILHNAKGIPSVLRHKHIHTNTDAYTIMYTHIHRRTRADRNISVHTSTYTHRNA